MSKKDSKNYILPHSEKKLRFYNEYLKIYIRILALSPFYDNINVYDIFCGTGIYRDGKFGSPIIAFESIRRVKYYLDSVHKNSDKFKLIINDGKKENIKKVSEHLLNSNKNKICDIEVCDLDASVMFEKVILDLEKQNKKTRNLFFIDPYGYKDIHKKYLEKILQHKNSEIILFLPVSHMYRFSEISLIDEENISFDKLRIFISEFFPDDVSVIANAKNIIDYIDKIKNALSLSNKFYSASFYIQRDKANYNAVFFISSHIFGFEKILSVKWELDNLYGKGWSLNRSESLFPNMAIEDYKIKLEGHLREAPVKNNIDIYRFTLMNEYLPKHANSIMRKWKNDKQIEIINFDDSTPNNKGFYINYDNYKTSIPKVLFRFKY